MLGVNSMAILEGVLGGLAGAVATLLATEIRRSFSERTTAIIAVGTELAHNLYVACDVLKRNAALLEQAEERPFWELVAFSDSSWKAVLNSGALSRLSVDLIEPLTKAYAELRKADYSAEKLQVGRVHPTKVRQYTVRVYDAGAAVNKALLSLTEHHRYQRPSRRIGQVRSALTAWEAGAPTWGPQVEAARL
jgi:hypothetical protein